MYCDTFSEEEYCDTFRVPFKFLFYWTIVSHVCERSIKEGLFPEIAPAHTGEMNTVSRDTGNCSQVCEIIYIFLISH